MSIIFAICDQGVEWGGGGEGRQIPILYQSHLQINWIYHIFDTTNGEYYTVTGNIILQIHNTDNR